MRKQTKTIFGVSALIAGIGLLMIIAVVMLFIFVGLPLSARYDGKMYVTTNIADYGNYIGNYNNDKPEKLIATFFPKRIDESFQNVSYSYRAMTGDSYAFEAVLEFTIADKSDFDSYVAAITNTEKRQVFRFDENFVEYILSDDYRLLGAPSEPETVHIDYSDIRKILVSESEQRIIFVALGVFDGGYTPGTFLTTFFDRFEISIKDYYLRDYYPET